ncbi:unnamed protein product [Trichobilharzia regenti]|nr:unnamed protein product [Trichobilharzia regenti]
MFLGASSGIGRATAVLFAELGACIALVARDKTRLEETRQACIKAAQKEVYEIEKAYRLVNNAGCMIRDTAETFNVDEFDRLMKVNLTAAISLTHLAIPDLTVTKGAIVNVSSVCGNRSFPGVMSYCISKAALDQFTRCTALGNPAVIVTELHRRSGMSEKDYSDFVAKAKDTHALGRTGTVEEVAQAIAFLSSSASTFTTGSSLMVDGGRSIMCPR